MPELEFRYCRTFSKSPVISENEMGCNQTTEAIEVRHSNDVPGVELRIGSRVARHIPRHWHEEYQFCLMQFGSGELTYRTNNFLTPTASLFMVHPGEVHANRCCDPLGVNYRNVFIDVALMSRLATEVVGKTTEDRKSTRLNSSHRSLSRMPSSA